MYKKGCFTTSWPADGVEPVKRDLPLLATNVEYWILSYKQKVSGRVKWNAWGYFDIASNEFGKIFNWGFHIQRGRLERIWTYLKVFERLALPRSYLYSLQHCQGFSRESARMKIEEKGKQSQRCNTVKQTLHINNFKRFRLKYKCSDRFSKVTTLNPSNRPN